MARRGRRGPSARTGSPAGCRPGGPRPRSPRSRRPGPRRRGRFGMLRSRSRSSLLDLLLPGLDASGSGPSARGRAPSAWRCRRPAWPSAGPRSPPAWTQPAARRPSGCSGCAGTGGPPAGQVQRVAATSEPTNRFGTHFDQGAGIMHQRPSISIRFLLSKLASLRLVSGACRPLLDPGSYRRASTTVRPTVHSRSCDPHDFSQHAPGLIARLAVRKRDPVGHLDVGQVIPALVADLSASTTIWNASGSARREVRMSISIAVHPPIAISSSSVGVKSPRPRSRTVRPPRALTTENRPVANRRRSLLGMPNQSPCPHPARPGIGSRNLAKRKDSLGHRVARGDDEILAAFARNVADGLFVLGRRGRPAMADDRMAQGLERLLTERADRLMRSGGAAHRQ